MFIRKNWLPLSVFLIAIVMVGLYVLQTRTEKVPIKIYKTTEVEKPTQPQAPVGDTSQGGHFHEDSTWHAGPHADPEAHSRDASTQPAFPDAPTETSGTHAEGDQGSTAEGVQIPVKLDPETQKKVDALIKQADALSEEAGVWSDKLYAESQGLLKEVEAIRAENAKRREMGRDPTVDEATYKAFDEALDARVRAQNAEAIRLNDLHIQTVGLWKEAMRLRTEARKLQGLE